MWKLSREKALLFRQKVQVTGKFCVIAVDVFLSCMQPELLAFRSRSDPNQNTGKETHYRWQLCQVQPNMHLSQYLVSGSGGCKERSKTSMNITLLEYFPKLVIYCRGTSQLSFIYTSLKNVSSVRLVVSLYLFFIKEQVQITVGLPGIQPFPMQKKTSELLFSCLFLIGETQPNELSLIVFSVCQSLLKDIS